MLGVMIDCSRNAVMKPEKVKEFASIIRKMGYDTLMLYTEDTYEVDNQPLFGYMRGRYTKEELKEIDLYCKNIGIELVPCIQTLAHLSCMFKWKEYKSINDCDDILLIDEEKTYRLIEDMFSSLSQCFSSKKIHIGMDEAWNVGIGRYKTLHGDCDRFELINKHLHRVCETAKKYGLQAMLWSDMFCRLASGSNGYYNGGGISKILEKAALPDNVSLIYWDYYSNDYQRYHDMIKLNQAFGREVIFAGGAWTWKGFAPDNTMSIENTEAALNACRDCGVNNVFLTAWGDDGAECSCYSVLPTMMYAAEKIKGNDDMASIKERFKEITGCDFDSFMLLDGLDTPGGKHEHNPSKYLLYNDLFCGLNDYRCNEADDSYYRELAEKLRAVNVTGKFGYLFDMYTNLADVLAVKSSLGIRTRKVYLDGDKEALKGLAEDYSLMIEKLEKFHEVFEEYWLEENKPFGFEIQDIRIGGVLQRAKSCRGRLLKFINGETESIPELEEKLIEENCGIHWSRMISAGCVTHYL